MTRGGPIVLKFGGSALSDGPGVVDRVLEASRERVPLVVVVSAREGVTDLLRSVIAHPRAKRAHRATLDQIARLHPDGGAAGRRQLARLEALVHQLERVAHVDRPLTDRVLSQGERLAVHWLVERLAERGLRPVAVEADHLGLITDNAYGRSLVLLERSAPAVRRTLGRWLRAGRLPVVTGFFGRSLEGRVATLGRGGSDYSASAIGAILGARRVELVKRNVSVLTADPRLVPTAHSISDLSYEEAEELAQFGARVLHPLAVEPARARGVELRVGSLRDPRVVTTIGPRNGVAAMRAVTLLSPLRLFRVRVPGGRQRPGVVAEVSERLRRAGVNVVMMFTSSALLSIVLEPVHARDGLRALAPLRDGSASVEGPLPVALVTAIGDGILGDLGRLPDAVLAGAEGFSATPRSFSLAVPQTAGERSLRQLHRALVERLPP